MLTVAVKLVPVDRNTDTGSTPPVAFFPVPRYLFDKLRRAVQTCDAEGFSAISFEVPFSAAAESPLGDRNAELFNSDQMPTCPCAPIRYTSLTIRRGRITLHGTDARSGHHFESTEVPYDSIRQGIDSHGER
ncbi:MAG: hypothetical protein EPN36_13875 [Rhodanobacteraceae bacterium]|nr:MAG: hypothetical protein EPN36_13875 [Rhodanobacteraceae bacterium]